MSKKLNESEVVKLHDILAYVMDFKSLNIDSKMTTSLDKDYSAFLTLWYKDTESINVLEHKMKVLKLLDSYGLSPVNTLWGYSKERIAIYIPDNINIDVLCGLLILTKQK